MRQKSIFRVGIAMLLMTITFLSTPLVPQARAEEDMWSKLGRGISNIGTGWMEIFNQPTQMAEEKRWPIALAGGIPKGIFYFYMRTMVGVYETVTFFVPAPANYQPIMEPEFIMPSD